MAKRIESLPPVSGRQYDWDAWLDGTPWELIQGKDFTVRPASFRANAAQRCDQKGLRLITRIRGNHVYIQAVPK